RSIGKQINRRFKQMQLAAFSCCGNPKRIMLVAAGCVPDEIRAYPTQVCIAGFAVPIHTDKYDVMIRIAFIESSCADTKIYQITVDTSAVQIFHGVGGAAARLWQ